MGAGTLKELAEGRARKGGPDCWDTIMLACTCLHLKVAVAVSHGLPALRPYNVLGEAKPAARRSVGMEAHCFHALYTRLPPWTGAAQQLKRLQAAIR